MDQAGWLLMDRLCLIIIPMVVVIAAGEAASAASLPSCPSKCGDVDIPYPFGIGPNCSFQADFSLTCNDTTQGKKPFWWDVEVVSISMPQGQIRMRNHISRQCYDVTTNSINSSDWSFTLENTSYRFSDALNKFTVIGCDTLAYSLDYQTNDSYLVSGCGSKCVTKKSLVNGTCTGSGCCQTPIPKDLRYYEVSFDTNHNSSAVWRNFGNCSYAVMLEEKWFQYKTYYSTTDEFWNENNGTVPVVMDWAIGNQTCEEVAKRNQTSSACVSENSMCVDSSNGPGYRCKCSDGYQGNPYLKVDGGCQDIDECQTINRCPNNGICHNLPGHYNCTCPPGTHSDPSNGPCTTDQKLPPNQKLPLAVKVVVGTSSGLAFAIFCSMCVCMITERRKRIKDRERYFREHGGRLLLEEIKERQGLAFKIFSKDELEKATNKFDQNHILGRGGHGTVYKGVLMDTRIVAIKKSKIIDDKENKEFGKEMLILSQVNHKNIVKLLGCCLEVEVPMLVYEFISNGTLFHLIHDNNASPISLTTRLRIAYESADALAYLHSSASPPIIHGDVKTSNILLDENYNAKISDFGSSKLIPKDEDEFATLVQGTCGYLDPEYLQTGQLTDKSDVYSFGVVLLEVLTGRKAIYFEGSEDGKFLVSSFFLVVSENCFSDILDSRVKDEADAELIEELKELIKQCLHLKGDGRPTMKEVAEELDKLRKLTQHPWSPCNSEEITSLLGDPSSERGIGENYHRMDTTTCYVSEKGYALDIKSGR